MGFLNLLKKGMSKDADFQAEKKSRKITKLLDDREKSSNERVLESIMEKKRQEAIKNKLEQINKSETHNQFTQRYDPGKNIFRGHNTILKNTMPILKSNKNILKQKSIFFK